MRVNPDKLGTLAATAAAHLKELRSTAQTPMLLAGEHLPPGVELDSYRILRADGTKNMARLRAMVAEAYDGQPPMTEPPRRTKKDAVKPRKKPFVPQVKTSRGVLEESGDPRLEAFAEYGEWASVENMVVPALEAGTRQPLHTRWRVVDSGRISSAAPNLTNLSARNKAIRECLIPRPGWAFLTSDHEGLENATLAQFCVTELGRNGLAKFYNERGNLHCLVAAAIHGCTYEEALILKAEGDLKFLKGAYKCAKYLNFGMPGGAGWRRMQFTARQMGHMRWTEAETKGYIAAHAKAVPDLQAYLQWVKRQPQDSRGFQVKIPGTGINRRGITYCSACNNGFQALGAVVEIHVGWELRRRILEGGGALRNCRIVNHPHDEWILECPIGLVHEAGEELHHVMESAPRQVLPDVSLRAETLAMSYWSKDAMRLIGEDGRLQIWPLQEAS
jgi:hypothetical protein